jgi:predicted flap endonuclease-1-like 5' DNA nuclease
MLRSDALVASTMLVRASPVTAIASHFPKLGNTNRSSGRKTLLESAGRPRPLAFNEVAAERLREAATLLAHQDDNPYRVAAYRRAADAVAALKADLRDVLEAGGIAALDEIPGVGRRIAGGLAELARTGRWTYLERLRGSGEPRDVFCAIPGVGPTLAKRLHETLHVETLEQLEAALHESGTKTVAGIGPRRLAILRAALGQMLARIRPVRTGPADEPPADVLLDVDREYRSKVKAKELRMIAPKRFNPKGEAWLPVLHTDRGSWHFTALFSNTARAHELGKVQDWVVLYFHSDSGGEAQRTIVTETRGVLAGHRVVRGRERECLTMLEHAASAG